MHKGTALVVDYSSVFEYFGHTALHDTLKLHFFVYIKHNCGIYCYAFACLTDVHHMALTAL